ncbi:MAG: hypothetical protein JNL26_14105 [Gemmatimonadetes bacterium]|nr:hypothetical protein [Gemmatimonadota bacterium]
MVRRRDDWWTQLTTDGGRPGPAPDRHQLPQHEDHAMTKEQKIEAFLEYLRTEGYVPTIDSDGDIKFKYEGGTYYLIVDANDGEFYRLIYPNFWAIEGATERSRVERAALQATAGTKVAKVFPVGENTWVSVEMFCPSADAFRAVLFRAVSAIRSAVVTFKEAMQS